MKPINLIISTLILSQGLFFAANPNNVAAEIVNPNQKEISSPIPQAKPLIATFKYVRPKTADNGSPFPKKSGYIKGYPVQFKQGRSTLTVDNSTNNVDIFMKLYALDSVPPQPVRVFFIRKGEKFKMTSIKAGSYDVRYRDLSYGGLSRIDSFNLKESRESNGIRFSNYTLILKARNGNMKSHPMSEQEF